MKYRFFLIIPLFFLFFFFTIHTSVFACGNAGETCCSQTVSGDIEGICYGSNECQMIDLILFRVDEGNPEYSKCLGSYTVTTPTPISTKQSSDVSISTITTTATKIPNTLNLSSLLTGGGFNLINFVFIIIGLLFFANLIMAGWDYMFSSGDPKKVTAATTRLINGVIGLAVAAAAFIVVRLITTMLGLGNLI